MCNRLDLLFSLSVDGRHVLHMDNECIYFLRAYVNYARRKDFRAFIAVCLAAATRLHHIALQSDLQSNTQSFDMNMGFSQNTKKYLFNLALSEHKTGVFNEYVYKKKVHSF